MHWASSSKLKIHLCTRACRHTRTCLNAGTRRWNTGHVSNMPHWLALPLFIYNTLKVELFQARHISYKSSFTEHAFSSFIAVAAASTVFFLTRLMPSLTNCLSSYLFPFFEKISCSLSSFTYQSLSGLCSSFIHPLFSELISRSPQQLSALSVHLKNPLCNYSQSFDC